GVTASLSGNTLTLRLSITFKSTFAGTKNIYMWAADANGTNSGWQLRGTWPSTAAPTVVTADSVAPSSGSGSAQTFTAQYSDSGGANKLATAWLWVNSTTLLTTSANSCRLYYDRMQNIFNLENDAGTASQSAVLGTSTTLENSQCSVAASSATVSLSGSVLTLSVAI